MEEQTARDAAEERYGQQIAAVLAEIQEILDGRSMRALRGAEAAQYQAARTRLSALVMAQRRMAKGRLAGEGESF